jgi:hypothetical protein
METKIPIPLWMIYIVMIWMLIGVAEKAVNIYFAIQERKLERARRTSSGTVSMKIPVIMMDEEEQ